MQYVSEMNFLNNLKSDGTKTIDTNSLTIPEIEELKKQVKLLHIRWILVLLASHLLLWTFSSNPSQKPNPELRKGHQWLTLPLDPQVPMDTLHPHEVTLIDANQKIVIRKAYLHPEVQKQVNNRDYYLVEVPKHQMNRLVGVQSLKAFPYFSPHPVKKEAYEIHF